MRIHRYGCVPCRNRRRRKAGRDAQAKADAIDAAVYDLKAVNPRAVKDADTRTTKEIIESIEVHGLTIEKAVASLKKLIAAKAYCEKCGRAGF